jgi:hypothetical protein
MVQTFGKRVLGGIGAPDSGTAKAYAEGVNTGISQRSNRQAMSAVDQEMRMREQDQQFKIEDREEAKRRRAAAAANAAAAKARNIATARAIAAAGGAGGVGQYWPGVNTRGAPATRPGALSMGTTVRETVAPPTAGGAVAPTAAATPRAKVDVAPRAGLRVNQVPAAPAPEDTPEERQRKFNEFMNSRAPDMNISNIEFVQGTYDKPGVSTGSMPPPVSLNRANAFRAAQTVGGYDPLSVAVGGTLEMLGGRTAEQQAGLQTQALAEAEAQARAYNRDSRRSPPPMVTIQGPNGPISVLAESLNYANVASPPIVPIGALPAGRMDIPVPAAPELGFGGAASPQTDLAGGTTYGGRLGAAPTPTEMFFADMGYTPAGQLDLQAIMADQTGPIKDPVFSQIAEQQRVMYMYAAEDAIANGDAAGYIEAQKGVKEQEMLILAQQVVAGGDEATNFGSTERLNMAASMIVGVDTVFVPNGDGTVDVYVDGQLDDENISIESIIDQLRSRVDTAYIEQMSTIAAENRAIESDIYKANRIEAFKSDQTMDRLVLANQLAGELAEAGEFNKLTVELMRESMVREGLLPADTPELKIQTNSVTGGFVVINPQTGDPVTQYVPNPNGDGSLVEQR